jgi:hypothetical protein
VFELPLDKAQIKTVGDHQYHIFPMPATHQNYNGRPTRETDGTGLPIYTGRGSNGSAKLHRDIHTAADLFMSALLDYGDYINDWSMRSAVIKVGFYPDDASQGVNYLRIIKDRISKDPELTDLTFPANLEEEAQSELGGLGDPRLKKFMDDVANSPGWNRALANRLFSWVHKYFAPRGVNPHATGFVFDLDFSIWCQHPQMLHGKQVMQETEVTHLNANAYLNGVALTNAVGMWINMYSMAFCFDSYDTGAEIWHMEYRNCPGPVAGKRVPFYDP